MNKSFYDCMYYVYMIFPQMRHCNIAHVCMYVCMCVCMGTSLQSLHASHSLKAPCRPQRVACFVCLYVCKRRDCFSLEIMNTWVYVCMYVCMNEWIVPVTPLMEDILSLLAWVPKKDLKATVSKWSFFFVDVPVCMYVCMHCINECKYYERIDIEIFGSRELFYKDEQFQYTLAIKMDVCKYVWLDHVRWCSPLILVVCCRHLAELPPKRALTHRPARRIIYFTAFKTCMENESREFF